MDIYQLRGFLKSLPDDVLVIFRHHTLVILENRKQSVQKILAHVKI